jgi:bromodomain-containing factor 1
LELDIDQITVPTLWKIHGLIMQHAPEVEAQVKRTLAERDAPRAPAKPAPRKKNKPMSKTEQERKIEQLKSSVQEFERQGSGSQEPVLPSKWRRFTLATSNANKSVAVEQQDESSGDEESDSEEE